MKIKLRDGIYHLDGNFDAAVAFDDLLRTEAPLRLNLAKVVQINSLGIQKFMQFLQRWGNQPLELHECSVSFIWTTQITPAIISHPGPHNADRVISFHVPYRCPSCKKTRDVLQKKEDIVFNDNGFETPKHSCPTCKIEMAIEDEPDRYFGFLRPRD